MCSVHSTQEWKVEFNSFYLNFQLIRNFSLDVDVLKNFPQNMLNLLEKVLKLSVHVTDLHNLLESYCKQIKFRNHQGTKVHFSQSFYSSPPSSSTSILPRTHAVHGYTAVQWFTVQWDGAVTSWVRERVMRPELFGFLFTDSLQNTSWPQPH